MRRLPELIVADRYCYSLHGLTIDSALELPPLRPGVGRADVVIEYGPVAELPADDAAQFRNWTAMPGRMVLTAFDTGRFEVSEGNRIAIDRFDGAAADDLMSFTLGSAMSALLQQRGLLPLHASSVVTPKGALLVTGRSGAGKSTLVAQLVSMGFPLLADDVTAIDSDAAGKPVALPGLGAMRLWQDALQRLDAEHLASARVRDGLQKFYLPASTTRDSAQPVFAIARLASKSDGALEISDLVAAEKLRWLNHHVHRKHFLPGMGLQGFAFDSTSALARHAPMIEVKRPDRGALPDVIANAVLDRLGL
jgi:hypothetical protein